MYREKKWKYYRTRSKYGNKNAEYNGKMYHSKFESKVAQELDLRIAAGELKEVERQVRIPLEINGQHICDYIIDFVATHTDGTLEYIEAKGFPTALWKLKWKMFVALYEDKENVLLTIIKL